MLGATMAFWNRRPPKGGLPAAGGKLRRGQKHGRWIEHDEPRPGEAAATSWKELSYVDGVLHGPFAWRTVTGVVTREGRYDNGELDGPVLIRYHCGATAGSGPYRAGKAHGHWRQLHETGHLRYESDYVDGERHGPWRAGYPNGQPREAGAHVHGKRDGEWTEWSAEGVVIEHGTYANGNRAGRWQLRRADGSIFGEGEYLDGVMSGQWRALAPSGTAVEPIGVHEPADLERWGDLMALVELLAVVDHDDAWAARARTQLWGQVESAVTVKTDALGQVTVSAPITAMWQLDVALGRPLQFACHNECWSRIVLILDALPAAQREGAVSLVERAGVVYPHDAPRRWVEQIIEGDVADPRVRLIRSLELARELTGEMLERVSRSVPQAEALVLRRCHFPDGLAPLFEGGYPALRSLSIARTEMDETTLAGLCELLGRATWTGNLQQLTLSEPGASIGDEQAAVLLENPHLSGLRSLALSSVTFGPCCARALTTGAAGKSLARLELTYATLTLDALVAAAACPALESLVLGNCTLPAMTSREAMTIASPALRRVDLRGSLGIERWARGDARSAYSVARRLAVIPALAGVEELDLSDNDFDDLAARVLARAPNLRQLRVLVWPGSEDPGDGTAKLYAVLGHALGASRTPKPAVFVMKA